MYRGAYKRDIVATVASRGRVNQSATIPIVLTFAPSAPPSTPSLCYVYPVFKDGQAIVSFDGFERIFNTSKQDLVQNAIKNAYNDISAGCLHLYQRLHSDSNISNQTLSRGNDVYTGWANKSPVLIEESERLNSCGPERTHFGLISF